MSVNNINYSKSFFDIQGELFLVKQRLSFMLEDEDIKDDSFISDMTLEIADKCLLDVENLIKDIEHLAEVYSAIKQ